MRASITFLLLFIGLLINAQNWQQDTSKTSVKFTIRNFGVNVDGEFKELNINTNYNKDDLQAFQLNAKISVKSIDTGIKGRDEHLLKENYFNLEKYPAISLTSQELKLLDNGDYMLIANLKIKGTTKKLRLPLKIIEEDNQLRISSSFALNRRDFDVGGGSLVMSKKVKVSVNYFGTR